MKRLEPLFARVILQREVPKQSSGGIILPEQSQKHNLMPEGRVVAVGPTCDPSIEVGMLVRFGKFAGDWIKLDKESDDEYFIVQDEDVLAIVRED